MLRRRESVRVKVRVAFRFIINVSVSLSLGLGLGLLLLVHIWGLPERNGQAAGRLSRRTLRHVGGRQLTAWLVCPPKTMSGLIR